MLEVKLEQTQTFVLDFSSRKCQPCFTLSPVTRSSATGGGSALGYPGNQTNGDIGFLLLLAHFEESVETFSFVLSLAYTLSIRTLGKVTLSGGKLLFLFGTSAHHQQTE